MTLGMERSSAQTIYRVLQKLNIPFRFLAHEPAFSMESLKPVEDKLGAVFCKNLFLANRQNTEHYLMLLEETKQFRTAEVSKKLGRPRLSFGREENLYQLLGARPGAISPLGLIFDQGHSVQLVIDRDLLRLKEICVHPCVNTESLALSTEDFYHRFLPATGHSPCILEVTGKRQ